MSAAAQIAVVAGLFVVYSAFSARLDRCAITGPIVFVVAGIVLGPEAADVLSLSVDNSVIEVLAELTLIVVLFSDAARIRLDEIRRYPAMPIRLLGVALPLSIVVGTVVGTWVLSAPWELAALAAAILVPTDAALGQYVVTNPTVPLRVRQALNVESGLNDGLSVPFVTFFLGLLAAEEGLRTPRFWAEFVLEQIGFGVLAGVLIGAAGGFLVDWATSRRFTNPSFRPIGMLATALLAASGAEVMGGNEFIAAFVAGFVAGNLTRDVCTVLLDFMEREGQLFSLLVFLIFGGAFVGPVFTDITWQMWLYAALSLTVIRMVPVAISLTGTRSATSTVAFVGWFGPRGLASIVLVLGAVEELGGGAEQVLAVVTATVALSVFAHGLSARGLSNRYGASMRRMAESTEEPMMEEGPAPSIRTRFGHLDDG